MRSAHEEALSPVDWRDFGPFVIGVDEVGRGCLAGPVYAAAVLFSVHDDLQDLTSVVTDSKKLTALKREKIREQIETRCLFAVASATVEEIDELNILQASLLAMQRAIAELDQKAKALTQTSAIVVDGHLKIPGVDPTRQTPLVKGDLRCAPVSAASIVAKVVRDRMMMDLAVEDGRYGFEIHKGYGTVAHRKALADHGPTIWHRRSFSGVKELLSSPS